MGIVHRLIDRLKTDEQLMREEMDLFSDILTHHRNGEQVPQRLNKRHSEKLHECVARGHVGNRIGGWDH
jgi:hypothetical protein